MAIRGDWPGLVTIRSGWWKAVARPLNDDSTDAVLRIERGSADFARRAAESLLSCGATAVNGPPLLPGSGQMFVRAGFEPHVELLLFERDLRDAVGDIHGVHVSEPSERESAAAIDNAAFPDDWRVGRLGLRDAMDATPESVMFSPDGGAGCAIVGVATEIGYLQRIAVHPRDQGGGLGRILVRASVAWARGHGARTMMLNTQMDNERAAHLYRSEGFHALSARLTIHRFAP